MSKLTLYRDRVPVAWVDYNGHMNDAAYAVVFSHATDALIEYLGMTADYRKRTGLTIYTLENHICYLQEAHRGEAIHVTTQLVDHDAKRLHVLHSLVRDADNALLATSEQMLMQVDASGPKSAAFEADVAERVVTLVERQVALAIPDQVGRRIGLSHR